MGITILRFMSGTYFHSSVDELDTTVPDVYTVSYSATNVDGYSGSVSRTVVVLPPTDTGSRTSWISGRQIIFGFSSWHMHQYQGGSCFVRPPHSLPALWTLPLRLYRHLNEVAPALTCSLLSSVISRLGGIKGIDLSRIGRNLWIIHKNMKYSDPEERCFNNHYL